MTITHNGTSYGTHLHGTAHVGPWERSESVQIFPGVVGAYTLQGKKHHRMITIPFHLTGYATHVLLLSGVVEFGTLQGVSGSLVVDLGGGDSSTFTLCTFLGFEPSEDPWKDGSGVNGWQQQGMLKFRQVAS